MSIGVFDYDWFTYNHTFPNLEVAKLCAYYRTHNELTVFTNHFNPDPYSRYIIRKDYDDGNYSAIMQPNIEYGGHAFSGNKYIALPEDIERTMPDFEMYKKYKSQFGTSNEDVRYVDTLLRGTHLRISLDGQTIWKDFTKAAENKLNRTVTYFHDYDLNQIKDAEIAVYNITHWIAKTNRGMDHFVGTKFPIQINDERDFQRWYKVFPNHSSFYIQFNGLISEEGLGELVKYNKRLAILLNYNLAPAWCGADHFFKEQLPQIYRQVVFLRSGKTKTSLIFDDKNLIIDERVRQVITLFNEYIIHGFDHKRCSMYQFVYKTYHNKHATKLKLPMFKIHDVKVIFNYIRQVNPETFEMFYQLSNVEYKGGKLVDEWDRCVQFNKKEQ